MESTTNRIRRLMFRTEAALEGDYVGEARNPAHTDRLAAVTRFISVTDPARPASLAAYAEAFAR